MNIKVKVARKSLMMSIAIIAATVVAACGNDTEAVATSSTSTTASVTTSVPAPPESDTEKIGPTAGTADSFWSEMAGEPLQANTIYADVGAGIGPLYGPSPTAGDFDAIGRLGRRCLVVLSSAHAMESNRFGVMFYAQTGYNEMIGRGKNNLTIAEATRFVQEQHLMTDQLLYFSGGCGR